MTNLVMQHLAQEVRDGRVPEDSMIRLIFSARCSEWAVKAAGGFLIRFLGLALLLVTEAGDNVARIFGTICKSAWKRRLLVLTKRLRF
jgi:hypothetical protein